MQKWCLGLGEKASTRKQFWGGAELCRANLKSHTREISTRKDQKRLELLSACKTKVSLRKDLPEVWQNY